MNKEITVETASCFTLHSFIFIHSFIYWCSGEGFLPKFYIGESNELISIQAEVHVTMG